MSGFDWAGLLRAGLHHLRLHPDQFWALTPAELALMLGVSGGGKSMNRNRLQDLLQAFPDAMKPNETEAKDAGS